MLKMRTFKAAYDDDFSTAPQYIKHFKSRPRKNNSMIPENFFNAPQNCNLHKYKLTMNKPTKCLQYDTVELLVMIRTIPANFDRRMAIRDTWGSKKYFPNINLVVVFLIGQAKDKQQQVNIETEDLIFGDILQEKFIESYLTLDIKTVMAWKWATYYCPNACHVMVANDEFIVDLYRLIPNLNALSSKQQEGFTFCLLHTTSYVFRDGGKWGVPLAIYESNLYPPYCVGYGYVAPSTVIRKLYFMSRDTPMFMPDDAWIGIVAERLGLRFNNVASRFIRKNVMQAFQSFHYKTSPIFSAVVDEEFPGQEADKMRQIWNLILIHHQINEKFLTKADIPYTLKCPENIHSSYLMGNNWLQEFIVFVKFLLLILFGYFISCKCK